MKKLLTCLALSLVAASSYAATPQFAIFWPQDGHQPCIGSDDIRKAIFKIKN